MQRTAFFHLLMLLVSTITYSQKVNTDQFYRSEFSPVELNETIEQRFDKIYNRYITRYGNDKKIDAKTFVSNYNYFLDRLNRSGKIFYGDEISIYLNQLKDFILSDHELKGEIKVYLTDFPYLNAFTNDFGSIYVNIGTLAKLQSEEELLYLLAHEISHILLRHSHKSILFESRSKTTKKDYHEIAFKRHEFSKEQEFEADLNAFELLKDRVDAEFDLRLLRLLGKASNPVFSEKVDLNLLAGPNTEINARLQQLSDNDTLNNVLFFLDDNDSLSTHPSSEKRVEKLKSLLHSYTGPLSSYTTLRDFSQIKQLAAHILVNSLIDAERYIDALDLILKMRQTYGDSPFLIEQQINVLTLLTFAKYSHEMPDMILNDLGNSCDNLNYLHLKKLLLSLKNEDFAVLALNSIEQLLERTPELKPKMELALQRTYQKFYQENTQIFASDSSSGKYYYAIQDSTPPEESSSHEKGMLKLAKELEKEGYHFITQADSSYFLNAYTADSSIAENYQQYIQNYLRMKGTLKKSVDILEGLLTPSSAAYKYNKGDFEKSPDFDIKHKSLIIQSDYVYFTSRNKRNFKVNDSRSLTLESKMIDFKQRYNPDQLDFSNRFGTKNTVYSNYLHKIIFDWMFIQSSNQLNYSLHEQEVREYLMKENIRYIVYNVCIVNRNKGRGRPNYSNYYEFYFDIEKREIVYTTKIGTRLNPSVYTLENLIYVTEYHKQKLK